MNDIDGKIFNDILNIFDQMYGDIREDNQGIVATPDIGKLPHVTRMLIWG